MKDSNTIQRTNENLPVSEQLAAVFHRNGYVRRQSADRLSAEGYSKYKKGDEVRLIARSMVELESIRHLLMEAGFKPGKPYAQNRQFRQPLYGRREVARFLKMIGEGEQT